MYNYVSCYCEIILQSITPFPLGACKVVHSFPWLVCYYGIQDYDYVFYTVCCLDYAINMNSNIQNHELENSKNFREKRHIS